MLSSHCFQTLHRPVGRVLGDLHPAFPPPSHQSRDSTPWPWAAPHSLEHKASELEGTLESTILQMRTLRPKSGMGLAAS